ncbi:MAG: IclR family transcriptional regulator [Devosia sp.]|uniref:IclR family transcriptional regulator n=1 Tax=Devosia sp. 66-22 TaxID=1895753 RepID=UPI000A83A7B0|nr:IclR family transcriptional regulator [Devosia sp. 66-22]MBN9346506.1 IclR family transcriptional regulator [Devosia sp.]
MQHEGTTRPVPTEGRHLAGDRRYLVKPLHKALRVLRIVCESTSHLTLRDVAEIAELPKTTVYRYLHTLTVLEMVDYNPVTETFSAGSGLWWLMQSADPYSRIRHVSAAERRKLRETFNETVNLGVLTGGEVIYLEIVESDRSLRMQAAPGTRDQIHSTALGKALLAFRPRSQWDILLPERLVRKTHNTLVERVDLHAELERVRQIGFAVERGENEDGATCVAAPILDANNVSLAAISISAPDSRMSQQLVAKISASLVEACSRIEQQYNRAL